MYMTDLIDIMIVNIRWNLAELAKEAPDDR